MRAYYIVLQRLRSRTASKLRWATGLLSFPRVDMASMLFIEAWRGTILCARLIAGYGNTLIEAGLISKARVNMYVPPEAQTP